MRLYSKVTSANVQSLQAMLAWEEQQDGSRAGCGVDVKDHGLTQLQIHRCFCHPLQVGAGRCAVVGVQGGVVAPVEGTVIRFIVAPPRLLTSQPSVYVIPHS